MAVHELAILVRAKGAAQAARDIGKVDKSASNLGKTAARGGNGIRNVVGAAIAYYGVTQAIQGTIGAASDLAESTSKATVVFGESSSALIEWSKTSAAAMGLSRAQALDAAGGFGNMFNTVGLAQDASADMSQTMVQLAADMASFNNEDPSEMLVRLRAGLSGEAEPLRRFGVLLSAARVQEEAYATGIAKRGEALTEAQKVQARYSLILKDSTIQQGDFNRTSEGTANQMRILRANMANVGATIGTALLPAVSKVMIRLNQALLDNQPAIEAFAAELPAVFDSLLTVAENVPWDAIKTTFQVIGLGAKAALEMFTSMPPWLQTAVLTGWGLNKLTGGLVGELGKGLIKGVLGMTAGVVNINAGVVNGGGGVPGAAPVAAAAAGAAGMGTAAALGIALPALGAAVVGAVNSPLWVKNTTLSARMEAQGLTQGERAAQIYYTASTRDQAEMRKRLAVLPTMADFQSGNAKLLQAQGINADKLAALREQADRTKDDTVAAQSRTTTAALETKREAGRGLSITAAATRNVAPPIVGAIRANRPIITVNVSNRITPASVTTTTTTSERHGPTTGSSGGSSGNAGNMV
jgi:hypothetical protein